MIYRTFTIFIAVFLLNFCEFKLYSQELSTRSERSIKMYHDAMEKMQIRNPDAAIEILNKTTENDPMFVEAWLLMADAYDLKGANEKVAYCCQKALDAGGSKYPVTYFFLAQAQFKLGKYTDAKNIAQTFLDTKLGTTKQKDETSRIITNCDFAIEALKHPVPFEPISLGDSINSNYDEYWPCLSADDETLIFTRLIPINENNKETYHNRQEDIFISKLKDSKWQKAQPIGPPINSPDNEGASFITSDGRKMYLTICNRADSKGRCDIYFSERTAKGWQEPKNIGEPVNSAYMEKQPSISSDGKTLYFVSNRPGGKGDYDIWASDINDSGKYSKPYNLGDSINTPQEEQSPFIHPDNQTFYFVSQGWPGMGLMDLYISRKKPDNSWTKAQNLGYPINTFNDEFGLIVNAHGDKAYFATNRDQGKGRDIFQFELYPAVRPVLVTYLKGRIIDAITKKPVEANFELIDLATSKLVNQAKSESFSGEFLVCIPTYRDYALNVSKEGYLFYSENFAISGTNDKTKPYLKNIELLTLSNGNKTILKNVFFETNSFELKTESTAELNKLVLFMENNPNIRIEIGGYTDNVGTDAFNQKLSENRAKAVTEYLINNGVVSDRIVYKGYGKSLPIANNSTLEGRSQNRRTEFKIIEK
jgi:outer membrane protein OmpA-like peptidoglycan-associated protein